MRTNLNLSSRPFRNHRLFWIAVAGIFFAGLWLALWVRSERIAVKAQAENVAAQIRAQEGEVKRYIEEQERRKQEEDKIVMNEHDAAQLASARRLIANKAFSWNRLIGDIERFVPDKAKVTSIQVAEASTESGSVVAQVEIKAIGQASGQLTEMMESLEKSGGLFDVRTFSQDAATDSGEVPFTIRVTYVPGRGEAG